MIVRSYGLGQLLGFDLFEDVAPEVSWATEEPNFRLSHLNSMRQSQLDEIQGTYKIRNMLNSSISSIVPVVRSEKRRWQESLPATDARTSPRIPMILLLG